MTASRVKNGALVAGLATVTFASRYQFIEVKNKDASTGLYVRTDGTAATLGGTDDDYFVAAGERRLIANQAVMWWQGFGAADGTKTNPGVTVKLAGSDSAKTNAFEIACVG